MSECDSDEPGGMQYLVGYCARRGSFRKVVWKAGRFVRCRSRKLVKGVEMGEKR